MTQLGACHVRRMIPVHSPGTHGRKKIGQSGASFISALQEQSQGDPQSLLASQPNQDSALQGNINKRKGGK